MKINDHTIRLYTDMLRIRRVEERIAEKYGEQKMRCPVHLSIGQEGVAAGTCSALEKTDLVFSTHRSHAHYIAKGGRLKEMIAEIYGKRDGCCGGRGGSMHLFDKAAGMLASVPIVSSSIPLGVGTALASQMRGSPEVSVVYFGDAAIEEGVFHESANFAAVKSLPVVFVCENNLYSVYTNLADRQPARPLTDLAKAHAIETQTADGNDVDAIYATMRRAVEKARNGGGPSFLQFDTYRWLEHCGPFYDNHIGYREEAEFLQWKERCPVETYRRKLYAADILDDAQDQQLTLAIDTEITDAFAFAEQAPFPAAKTAEHHVYAG